MLKSLICILSAVAISAAAFGTTLKRGPGGAPAGPTQIALSNLCYGLNPIGCPFAVPADRTWELKSVTCTNTGALDTLTAISFRFREADGTVHHWDLNVTQTAIGEDETGALNLPTFANTSWAGSPVAGQHLYVPTGGSFELSDLNTGSVPPATFVYCTAAFEDVS